MVNIQNQKYVAVGILFMLAASPLAVNFAQAEMSNVESELQKKHFRAVMTEKIVNGELKVRHYEVPENLAPEDITRVFFNGETGGWAFIQGKAYNAGIVLYDGQAVKVADRLWKLQTQGTIEVGGRNLDLDLTGRVSGDNVILHGTASNDDLDYKIVLSGKTAHIGDNAYAIAFSHAGLKDIQTEQHIKLYQIGQFEIKSANGHTDSFREAVSVE